MQKRSSLLLFISTIVISLSSLCLIGSLFGCSIDTQNVEQQEQQEESLLNFHVIDEEIDIELDRSLVEKQRECLRASEEAYGTRPYYPKVDLTYYTLMEKDEKFTEGYDAVLSIMSSGANADTPKSQDDVIIAIPEGKTACDLEQKPLPYQFTNLKYEDLDINMMNYVCFDHPLYSLYKTGADSDISMSFNEVAAGGYLYLHSKATKQNDDFKKMYQEVDDVAEDIVTKACKDANGSQLQYIRYITKYLAENTYYLRHDKSTTHCNDIYGALIKQKSRCYGYSCAAKYLMDKVGINNVIVPGTKHGERHAWNMVMLSGEWYVLDTTASSNMIENEKVETLDDCEDPYKYCLVPIDVLNQDTKNTYVMDEDAEQLLNNTYEEWHEAAEM